MPLPRQAQGRPGTAVIPAGWQAGHAPAIAKTLTSSCSIRHPGMTGGTFNATTGKKTGATAEAAHYTGACRVDELSASERMRIVADEEIPEITYSVTLERGAAPDTAVDDIVTVAGLGELAVAWVPDPSLQFSRLLYCTENQS